MLSANVLFLSGKPVAYNLCYLWNNTLGQIKTSYDSEYQEYSPGAVVVEEALRTYIKKNYAEFDFLGNVMPHKLSWTKKVREHESMFVFGNSFTATLIAWLKWLKRVIVTKYT